MILARAAAGLTTAALVALMARRAGALSASGAIAAALVGTAAVIAGWRWGILVIAYFTAASLLTHVGMELKQRRTGPVVAKRGERDALQVLANGGVFSIVVLLATSFPLPGAAAAGGALAAASADSWATEIGTLSVAPPRSVLNFCAVPAGTSGAVSVPGSCAMLAGAAFIALAARLLDVSHAMIAVTIGGLAGGIADTILGATVQERRWCATCERDTERRVHDCGALTELSGGLRWLDNDAVNLVATLVGAAVAAGVAVAARA